MTIDDLAPDEVLALRFDEAAVAEELAAWCSGSLEQTLTEDGATLSTIWVPTVKGPRPAVLGDWIVRHADDVHEVLDAPTFAALHSRVASG